MFKVATITICMFAWYNIFKFLVHKRLIDFFDLLNSFQRLLDNLIRMMFILDKIDHSYIDLYFETQSVQVVSYVSNIN